LRSSYCKKCERNRRLHYYDRYKDKDNARTKQKRQDTQIKLFEYLSTHPCVDCGESDIIVLEFDHRDPKSKVDNVSSMPKHFGWNKICEEIKKCDVRCVKCHRLRHAKENGWFATYQKFLVSNSSDMCRREQPKTNTPVSPSPHSVQPVELPRRITNKWARERTDAELRWLARDFHGTCNGERFNAEIVRRQQMPGKTL